MDVSTGKAFFKERSSVLLFLFLFFLSTNTFAESFYDIALKNYTSLGSPEYNFTKTKYKDISGVPFGRGADLNNDCGIIPPIITDRYSIEDANIFNEYYRLAESAYKAKKRTEDYLKVLIARDKLNPISYGIYRDIRSINDKLMILVKSKRKLDEKKKLAIPLFVKMEIYSSMLAKNIDFNYEGGCGAGEEDSQEVKFSFSSDVSQVKYITVFDYKICEYIEANPLDFNECDIWEDVLKREPYWLSGKYVIFAQWDDGLKKTYRFSALSTKPATLVIKK